MVTISRRSLLRQGIGSGLAATSIFAGTTFGAVSPARADIYKVPRVGVANELPYSFLDAQGNLTGQSVDVLRAALEGTGVETMQGTLTEFAALIPGLIAKRFDIVCTGMFIKPERCQLIAFANPDSMGRVGMIVPAGNPKKLQGFQDFVKNSDLKLAFIRASIVEQYARASNVPEAQWVVLPDFTTLLAAVQGGRADAALGGYIILSSTLKKVNEPSLQMADNFVDVTVNGKPAIDYAAMGFRKEDADLLNAYNAGLARLVQSGKLREINEKWGIPAGLTATSSTPTAAQICGG